MINNAQTIEDYADCEINHEQWSDNAIEDYMGTKDEVSQMVEAFNSGNISPQFGEGSPEGLITANYSLKYIDTLVPTEYYNETFGALTGWVAL